MDRLIDDLKDADLAGEPMGPIVSRRKLSEVGFGYHSSEVDAYLAMVCGVPAVSDPGTPVSGKLSNADQHQGERQPSVPETRRQSQSAELRSARTTSPVGVTLTKSRKSVAIFIFVIVVLMTALVLPTIFLSVVLPLFMD